MYQFNDIFYELLLFLLLLKNDTSQFFNMIYHSQDYAAEHGDADVPEKYDGDKELGKYELFNM